LFSAGQPTVLSQSDGGRFPRSSSQPIWTRPRLSPQSAKLAEHFQKMRDFDNSTPAGLGARLRATTPK
jgi:hypothetical protein